MLSDRQQIEFPSTPPIETEREAECGRRIDSCVQAIDADRAAALPPDERSDLERLRQCRLWRQGESDDGKTFRDS